MLLPLAPEPFTVPTDRDLLPSERREFVRTHRTCVYGYRRRNDGPAMSIVYYIPTDNDELLVSTMAAEVELSETIHLILDRIEELQPDRVAKVRGR